MRKAAIAAMLLLSACGGGGGGGGDGGVQLPTNNAPVITTSAALALAENVIGAAQLAASDADNDPIVWSLAGGSDSDRFVLNGNQLNFVVAPNFDAPGDSDGDNVFNVTVSASDGKTTVSRALAVTVTNSKEGIAVRRIGNVGEVLVGAARVRDNSIKLLGERSIYYYDPQTDQVALQRRMVDGLQAKFLSITADRAATAANMVVSARLADGKVSLFRLDNSSGDFSGNNAFYNLPYDPAVAEVSGEVEGCANGWLCLATSTEGKPAVANDSLYGAILAFRPNPDPYAGASVGPDYFPPEAIGAGLRLPQSMTLGPDPSIAPTLLVLDRGTTRWDEINRGVGSNPPHWGWPWREGTDVVMSGATVPLTDPQIQFRRGTGLRETAGLTAMDFYRGPSATLQGKLLVGDREGRIFAVPTGLLASGPTVTAGGTIENRTADFVPDSGTLDHVAALLSYGSKLLILDRDGDLFVFG